MAIDTRDKRASVIGFSRPSGMTLPNPDGGLNQGDRQQVAYSYRGIAAAAPGGATIAAQLRQNFQMIFSRVFGRVN